MGKKRRRRGKTPAVKPKTGWDFYTLYERCPDCDLRDALSITGKPRRDYDSHHKRLRRRGLGWMIRGAAHTVDDCEACGGTGSIRRRKPGDPMR